MSVSRENRIIYENLGIESMITRNVTKENAKTAMPKRRRPNGESEQSGLVQIMLMFRFLMISILLSSEVSM